MAENGSGARSILVYMPEEMKELVGLAAAREDRSVNDLAWELLAGRYGQDYTPSRSRRPKVLHGRPDVVYLRLPKVLKQAIIKEAVKREINMSAVIREVLADGVEMEHTEVPVQRAPMGGGSRK